MSEADQSGIIYKVLGLLVTYPEAELQQAVEEFSEIIANSRLSADCQKSLTSLLIKLGSQSLLDAQEDYVRIFDRSTRLSLYLYEHVHGESRDRGQAMVDLRAHYESFGMVPPENELPDYVPVFCEFISVMPKEEADGLLAEVAPIFGLIESRLVTRKSPYSAVFKALSELAGVESKPVDVDDAAEGPELSDHKNFDALDKVWEETEVTFGQGAAHDSCDTSRRPAHETLVQLRTNSDPSRGSSNGRRAN